MKDNVSSKLMSVILLCCVLTTSPSIVLAREIRIASTDSYPWHAAALKDGGPLNKALVAALARQGHTAKVDFLPWARAVEMAKNGSYDVLGSDYESQEKKANFLFTDSFWPSAIVFVKLKTKPLPVTINPSDIDKTLHNLSKYTIGTVLDFTYEDHFDRASYLKKEVVAGEDPEMRNLAKLVVGRVDLIIADRAGLDYLLQSRPQAKEWVNTIEYLEPPLKMQGNYYLVSKRTKNAKKLLQDINHGLKMIRDDGTLRRIMNEFKVK